MSGVAVLQSWPAVRINCADRPVPMEAFNGYYDDVVSGLFTKRFCWHDWPSILLNHGVFIAPEISLLIRMLSM